MVKDTQLTGNEFFQQKMNLLRHLLSYSEEMINGWEEWESIEESLDQRDRLIDQLTLLDAHKQQRASLSTSQQIEIRHTVDLIRSLDQEVAQNIREAQKEILTALKSNVQEQKLIPYDTAKPTASGRLIDCRK